MILKEKIHAFASSTTFNGSGLGSFLSRGSRLPGRYVVTIRVPASEGCSTGVP
jgi:hypothetical protein